MGPLDESWEAQAKKYKKMQTEYPLSKYEEYANPYLAPYLSGVVSRIRTKQNPVLPHHAFMAYVYSIELAETRRKTQGEG